MVCNNGMVLITYLCGQVLVTTASVQKVRSSIYDWLEHDGLFHGYAFYSESDSALKKTMIGL